MSEQVQTLPIGLTGEACVVVGDELTARHMGSGTVKVFATPEMVRLMERAAVNALAPHLSAGQQSVGTMVNVKHLAATPVGATVIATAELIGVEGRRLTFRVNATDGIDIIGEGLHERALIDLARFEQKAAEKRQTMGA